MRNPILTSVLLLLVSTLASAQNKPHPVTFDDVATLRSADVVAISPDGKTLLYRVRFGGSKGPENTEWRLMPVAGGESRQLAIPEKFDPVGFTRDGTALYGTYEVDKHAQLATFHLASPNTPAAAAATPVPLTALPRGIHSASDLAGWVALCAAGRSALARSAGRCTHCDRS